MFTSLFPYYAPKYIVIPESRYVDLQLEELENNLKLIEAKLETLLDTKKELDSLKSELIENIKDLKNSK